MPAFNFKAQFAKDVEDGRKRQTVRADRKGNYILDSRNGLG